MAWHQPGDKPLSEPMLTNFTDTYMKWLVTQIHFHIFEIKFSVLRVKLLEDEGSPRTPNQANHNTAGYTITFMWDT